jgi:hypothetical protein
MCTACPKPACRRAAKAKGCRRSNSIRRAGNQFARRSLYRRSRDAFLSRRSKAPAPRPPAPAGAFLFWAPQIAIRVSNFAQTATARGCKQGQRGMGGCSCRKSDQFWEYAREAMLLVCDAKTAKDKQELLELSGTWTQAALQSRSRQLGDVSAA